MKEFCQFFSDNASEEQVFPKGLFYVLEIPKREIDLQEFFAEVLNLLAKVDFRKQLIESSTRP